MENMKIIKIFEALTDTAYNVKQYADICDIIDLCQHVQEYAREALSIKVNAKIAMKIAKKIQRYYKMCDNEEMNSNEYYYLLH